MTAPSPRWQRWRLQLSLLPLLLCVGSVEGGGLKPRFTKWAHNGDVVHLIDDGFVRFRMKTNKFMALFWEPRMADEAKIKQAFADASLDMRQTFYFVAVDCSRNKKTCAKFKVKSTPTVKYFDSSAPYGRMYGGVHWKRGYTDYVNMRLGTTKPPESWEDNGNVTHLTGSNFHRYKNQTGDFFTMFYDPGCKHCKKMKPEYARASVKASHVIPFTAVNCKDNQVNQVLCIREGVTAFPTLMYYHQGALVENITGAQDEQMLYKIVWITRHVAIEAPGFEEGDGEVIHVLQQDWTKHLEQHQQMIHMFYANWCEHSKAMMPTFRDASISLKGVLTMSAVDCDIAPDLCHQYQIGGYPTVVYLNAETKKRVTYDGGRSVSELVDFGRVNSGLEPSVPEQWDDNGDVLHATSYGFDEFVSEHTKFFAMFYSPKCGSCAAVKPEFAAASTLAKDVMPFVAIDCEMNGSLCSKHGVKSLPKMMYVMSGSTELSAQGDGEAETGEGLTMEEYQGNVVTGSFVTYARMKDGQATYEEFEAEELRNEPKPEPWEQNGKVEHLTRSTFGPFRKTHPKSMVMFYAPWCAHCNDFKPTYAKVSGFALQYFPLAAVDCTMNKPLCNKLQIKGYPTILYFENADDEKGWKYPGDRRIEAHLKEFVAWKGAEKSTPQTEPKLWTPNHEVVHLTDYTFDNFVETKEKVLVVFHAPWCGASTAMKPRYAGASKKVHDLMPLAALDCIGNDRVCETWDMKTFPTYVYFENGVGEVQTKLTAKNIVEFVQLKVDGVETADGLPEWQPDNGAVVHLADWSFQDFQTHHPDGFMVMFYAPWCGHCKRFKPEYAKTSTLVLDIAPLAALDCDAFEGFCVQQDVKSFPTIKWFSAEESDGISYPGKRTTNGITDFVKAKTGIDDKDRSWKANKADIAFISTETTLGRLQAQQTKDNGAEGFLLYLWTPEHKASVQFQPSVAQLSGYTKEFFPIAAVNCAKSKAICDGFGGYPEDRSESAGVFKLFLDGAFAKDYQGQMNTEQIVYFILDEIGMSKQLFMQKYTTYAGKGGQKKIEEKEEL